VKIVWLSWKDRDHPLAGGAETVSGELMDRLIENGHEVRLITSSYGNSKDHETAKNGLEIYRSGSRYTVYRNARKLFKTMKDWPDLVIDEMNTLPFGAAFYTKKSTVLLTYQLARKVWFYQMPLPLSVIGYITEPIYLYILSRKRQLVITESESTKIDLAKYGFNKKDIKTFSVGMDLEPVSKLSVKPKDKTVLALGSVRPMKRTLDIVKGFENARDSNEDLRLTIAGDTTGKYGEKLIQYVKGSRHKNAIAVLGRVSAKERIELMKKAYIIVVTSVKEGWGLIVTEANSQGTPAIAYNVDGLRDSVTNNETGILVESGKTKQLGREIIHLVEDTELYEKLRANAWESSKKFTFDNSYKEFMDAIAPITSKEPLLN
jgi:glycosyltransferase involved in cell wall biosynthesis